MNWTLEHTGTQNRNLPRIVATRGGHEANLYQAGDDDRWTFSVDEVYGEGIYATPEEALDAAAEQWNIDLDDRLFVAYAYRTDTGVSIANAELADYPSLTEREDVVALARYIEADDGLVGHDEVFILSWQRYEA